MTRTMYDSVDPNAIPATAQMVAGYIDGNAGRWPDSAWSRFPSSVKVRIARRTTTNDGHVLDVEAGIPTVWPPSRAIVDWVLMRRASGVEPTIYCNQLNDWNGIRALFRNAGVSEPSWWVARYNGDPAIPGEAIAKQYANPPVHGQGHFDLSSVRDYWPGVDNVTNPNEPTTEQKIDQMYDAMSAVFIHSGGTSIAWVFTQLYDFFASGGELSLIQADLATIKGQLDAISVQLAQLIGNGVTIGATGTITVQALPPSA